MSGYDLNSVAKKFGINESFIQKLDKEIDNDGVEGKIGRSVFDAASEIIFAYNAQKSSNQDFSQTLLKYAGEFGQALVSWVLESLGVSDKKISKKDNKAENNVKSEMQSVADKIKESMEATGDISGIKIKGLPNGTTLTNLDVTVDFSDSTNDEFEIEDGQAKVIKKADSIIITISYTYNGKQFEVSSISTDKNLLDSADEDMEQSFDDDVSLSINGIREDEEE